MLQLYGNPRSRAMRCLWMLEEMGEPYQLIEKTTRTDELQTAEYLRLNPNARIPTLVDGEVVLWESMAINLYLAQKYEGPMLGKAVICQRRARMIDAASADRSGAKLPSALRDQNIDLP
jgi:glutathione S-transferase